MRHDGFGGRVCALVNAMALAKKMNWPFKFSWPPMTTDSAFHSIDSVDEIFGKRFIDRFFDPNLSIRGFIRIENTPVTCEMIKAIECGERDGIFVTHIQGPIKTTIGVSISAADLAEAFARVEFSTKIQLALRASKNLRLRSTIAVHARHGDVVHGENRYRLFNYKYVPLAIVKQVVEHIRQLGKDVIFFSDHSATTKIMKEHYGLLTADDFCASESSSPQERTAFDIGLMARCGTIVGSQSIFAVAASMYGQVPIIDMLRYAKTNQLRSLIFEDLSACGDQYSPLEREQSLQWVATELTESL